MMRSILIWGASATAILLVLGFAGWMWSLPAPPTRAEAPEVPADEAVALLASLKPPAAGRPLVAVLGLNDATETTDYLMPSGILRRADVADVKMLSKTPGPVRLFPALKVEADSTIATFDAAHPNGADYVIVPAMSRDDDPTVLDWIKSQSRKGARIIGICAGAKVVAAAGLLDGRRATTHWYYLSEMLRRNPTIDYVPDRRMVGDGNVVTTTGVSASMPMTLTLIEAIAGRAKAEAVARELGLESWDARHASSAFKMTRPFVTTVLRNRLAFWDHDVFGIGVSPGIDEVSLALVADAWSRTYRSKAITFSRSPDPVMTANGIRLLPDQVAPNWPEELRISSYSERPPAGALNQTLQTLATRYGKDTASVVAMQLEYPRSAQ
jgi:putative intracellular protease/amidase